jgi:hypothetical protein
MLLIVLTLSCLAVVACDDLVPRDTSSLFVRKLCQSEIFGLLLDASDIEVKVHNGVVTLCGAVSDRQFSEWPKTSLSSALRSARTRTADD